MLESLKVDRRHQRAQVGNCFVYAGYALSLTWEVCVASRLTRALMELTDNSWCARTFVWRVPR